MLGDDVVASPTLELAKFASRLKFSKLPKEIVEHAKLIILDTVGCGLYGSKLPWGQIVADYVREMGSREKATVWGNNFKAAAANASLANSTMVHGFELDDLHKNAGLHGGGVTTCAALAMAEEKGGASGEELITAVVAGYEVGARIGTCMGHAGHALKGFHPTGTIGAFAASAAAGRMLNLDEEKMVHCLGIGGTQGAGLLAAQFSSMVKRMHAGRAAQSGIYAAQLAQKGFTGITNILESEYGGFCTSESKIPPDLKYLTMGLEDRNFWIMDVGFKPYSCCGACHTPIDALDAIMKEHKLTADRIEKIRVQCSLMTYEHVGWEYEPESITAAQMNLFYCLAIKAFEDEVFVDQFTEEKIKDPKILNFIKNHIEVIHNPEFDKLGREGKHTTLMEVRTKKGEVFTKHLAYAKGSHKNPLSREEVIKKFEYLTSKVFDSKKTGLIFDAIMTMERLEDVRSFAKLLMA